MKSPRTKIQREVEFRRCKNDPAYFFKTYWQVRTPDQGLVAFELFDYQHEALARFIDERFILVLKARQIGLTTLLAGYMFWFAWFQNHKDVLVLSVTERDANQVVAKVKDGYRGLPEWLRERGPSLLTEHQQKMPFSNGSTIESLPSRNDPARGRTASLVVLDEWASYDNPTEAWASVGPVADVGGRIIALSTAKGSGNMFHKQWVRSASGKSKFKSMFFPWSVRPERDQEWYERQRLDYAEWQLAQEFPTDPEEAFIKSGRMVFDLGTLDAQATREPDRGRLVAGSTGGQAFMIDESPESNLNVWELPEPSHTYVVGADVAMGVSTGDYSAAHVIDCKTGNVVAVYHGHIDPDLFGGELARLGRFYNRALVGVESNNHGLTTLKSLQRSGYPNIYFQRSLTGRYETPGQRMGWRTTKASKPLMINGLVTALREGLLKVPDGDTVSELRGYVMSDDGRTMFGSPHDDRVIALAIAEQMRQYSFTPEARRTEPQGEYWSFDWWSSQIDKEELEMGIGSRSRNSGTLGARW
jgi:hypothetical protein